MIFKRTWLAPALVALLVVSSGARSDGQSLCSGGSSDGNSCQIQTDCADGVCVIIQGICDGGGDDGLDCDCPGATCNVAPACSDLASAGTCGGGGFQGECCDAELNCTGGNGCRGTQKICASGEFKGLSCLKDADCLTGVCLSSGKRCLSDQYPCFDDTDCVNTNDHCEGPGFIPPTPSPTRTPSTPGPTPTTTPGGSSCVGDCSRSGDVTVDELLRLVNIALGNLPISSCPAGNPNGDNEVTIDEILTAVNNALNGCPVTLQNQSAIPPAHVQLRRWQRRRH